MFVTSTLLVSILLRPAGSPQNLDPWFLKDKNSQSCASCHSPDGIELRSFSDSDIVRRAKRHHGSEVADKIRLLLRGHPRLESEVGTEIRPLQPGGKYLPGKTPIDRDRAFILSVKAAYPILFKPIKGRDEALAWQKVILGIKLEDVPVGIQMNRLSEDGAHGEIHKSIANWFPDVPVFDSNVLRSDLETYLAKPTDEQLEKVDQKVVSLAIANSGMTELSLAKFRSLLAYQHMLRTKAQRPILLKNNPFWHVGEFGRFYAESEYLVAGVPTEIVTAKNLSTTFKRQLKELRLPWFWLGWILDPSLTKSGPSKETNRAEYFTKFLEDDGPYMGHEIFMLSRKLAEQNRNPLYPNIPFEIQYSFFLTNTPLIEREPKDPQTKSLFRALTTNSFLMTLYLLEDDLKRTGKTIRKVPQLSQIKFITQYLKDIKTPKDELINRVVQRLTTAKGI